MNENGTGLPRLSLKEGDLLAKLLRSGQQWLHYNPRIVQALIQATVAEGRAFAQTEDGQAWQKRMNRSGLIKSGRLIWQAYGLDNFLEDEPGLIPSEWLDRTISALKEVDLESLLSKLMQEGIEA